MRSKINPVLDEEAPAEPHQAADERLHGLVPAQTEADHPGQPRRSQCRNIKGRDPGSNSCKITGYCISNIRYKIVIKCRYKSIIVF